MDDIDFSAFETGRREMASDATIRDYFAAQADISGMKEWEQPQLAAALGMPPPPHQIAELIKWEAKAEALYRYMKADAMLAARKEG